MCSSHRDWSRMEVLAMIRISFVLGFLLYASLAPAPAARSAVLETVCLHGFLDDAPNFGWTLGHGQQLGIRCPAPGTIYAVGFSVEWVVVPGALDIVIYDGTVEVSRTNVFVGAPGSYEFDIPDVAIAGDARVVLCPVEYDFFAVTGEEFSAPPRGGSFLSSVCSTETSLSASELVIYAIVDQSTGVESELRSHLALVVSNPYTTSRPIRMSVPAVGSAQAWIYDTRGQKVRSLLDGPVAAGIVHLGWDGLTDSGHAAPAGVYVLRARSGRLQSSAKFVLLRSR